MKKTHNENRISVTDGGTRKELRGKDLKHIFFFHSKGAWSSPSTHSPPIVSVNGITERPKGEVGVGGRVRGQDFLYKMIENSEKLQSHPKKKYNQSKSNRVYFSDITLN